MTVLFRMLFRMTETGKANAMSTDPWGIDATYEDAAGKLQTVSEQAIEGIRTAIGRPGASLPFGSDDHAGRVATHRTVAPSRSIVSVRQPEASHAMRNLLTRVPKSSQSM